MDEQAGVESAVRAVVIYGYEPELNRRFVQLSSMLTTVGGYWELRAAALLKAWWGMRLASLLTHLFCFFIRLRISQRRKKAEA